MLKITRTLGPILLITGLILTGCNFPRPTQTASPTPTLPPELSMLQQTPLPAEDPAACLSGSWQIQDVTPILTAVIPPGTLESNQITLTGSEGIFRYDFLPDGTLTGTAQQYKVLGKAKRGPFNLDVVAELNGSGSGLYSVEPNTGELVLSSLVDNGFNLDIRVAGVSVYQQDSSQLNLWFGGEEKARIPYECSGTTLVLRLNVNGQSLPVVFNRINP